MKRNIKIITALVIAMLTACSHKEESKDIIIEKMAERPIKKGIQKMDDMDFSSDIDWLGANYKIIIHRNADENLKKVKDESGNTYCDNKINIIVRRHDGSDFFNRTFSKADFSSCLDAQRKENGALLGLMFSKVEGNNLIFEGSVGSPDPLSDEFIPIVLTLNKMGSIKLERATIIDSGGNSAGNDEEGV